MEGKSLLGKRDREGRGGDVRGTAGTLIGVDSIETVGKAVGVGFQHNL